MISAIKPSASRHKLIIYGDQEESFPPSFSLVCSEAFYFIASQTPGVSYSCINVVTYKNGYNNKLDWRLCSSYINHPSGMGMLRAGSQKQLLLL